MADSHVAVAQKILCAIVGCSASVEGVDRVNIYIYI